MESVSFVGIDIKVIAWNEGESAAVAEDWLAVPPPVDAHNVERYVIGRFGEPVDIALGSTDVYGEILMGWVFPSAALRDLGLPSDGLEMMVVPFVRFPDGTRRELFEYNAELNREFAGLVESIGTGSGRPGTSPSDGDAGAAGTATSVGTGTLDPGELAPVEHRSRLEDERLTLAGTSHDLIELQLGGWLRRMLLEGWSYLIVQLGHDGRYVQFLTHDGSWLRCEAVGDRYLGEAPLSRTERDALASLGWDDPSPDPDGCGNHSMDLGEVDGRVVTDAEITRAASIAATTLCEVFGPVRTEKVEIMVGHASTIDD